MKTITRHLLAMVAVLGLSHVALAHVGVVNTQLPYALAGKSYELVLAVPHGCAYTAQGGGAAEADTYKVEVTIPAGFTGVRPILDGVFGKPALTKNEAAAVTKMTWTKSEQLNSAADDQSYRIALRGTAPNAPFTVVQFNTKQFCKNPLGGDDLVVDWSNYGAPASNQSPKVKIYPTRTPGWNKYNLAANNEKHALADVRALLTDFFSEAQIVWLMPGTNNGRGAYSANTNTTEQIRALATKDSTVYELSARETVMIHSTDDIWAKF